MSDRPYPLTLQAPSGATWLDHILLGTPDVEATARTIEEALGVTCSPLNVHRGLGTHNVVLGLKGVYLEIIGPKHDDPEFHGGARWFGLDDVTEAKIVALSAGIADIDVQIARARERGWDPGDAAPLERATADGGVIKWRLSSPRIDFHGGVVPFMCEWKETPSPADTLDPQAEVQSVALTHPDVEEIRRIHDALEISVWGVTEGPAAARITLVNGDRSITI